MKVKIIVSTALSIFLGFPVVTLLLTLLFRWHIFVASFLFDIKNWKDTDYILMYGIAGILGSIIFGLLSLSYWLDDKKEE